MGHCRKNSSRIRKDAAKDLGGEHSSKELKKLGGAVLAVIPRKSRPKRKRG